MNKAVFNKAGCNNNNNNNNHYPANHIILSVIVAWQYNQSSNLIKLQDMEGGLELAVDCGLD